MRKPILVSHYLILKDLMNDVDVRQFNDRVVYFTARIENIKNDLVKQGLRFDEEVKANSSYSHYKPYILIKDNENMELAKRLLRRYKTDKVILFLTHHGRGISV